MTPPALRIAAAPPNQHALAVEIGMK